MPSAHPPTPRCLRHDLVADSRGRCVLCKSSARRRPTLWRPLLLVIALFALATAAWRLNSREAIRSTAAEPTPATRSLPSAGNHSSSAAARADAPAPPTAIPAHDPGVDDRLPPAPSDDPADFDLDRARTTTPTTENRHRLPVSPSELRYDRH